MNFNVVEVLTDLVHNAEKMSIEPDWRAFSGRQCIPDFHAAWVALPPEARQFPDEIDCSDQAHINLVGLFMVSHLLSQELCSSGWRMVVDRLMPIFTQEHSPMQTLLLLSAALLIVQSDDESILRVSEWIAELVAVRRATLDDLPPAVSAIYASGNFQSALRTASNQVMPPPRILVFDRPRAWGRDVVGLVMLNNYVGIHKDLMVYRPSDSMLSLERLWDWSSPAPPDTNLRIVCLANMLGCLTAELQQGVLTCSTATNGTPPAAAGELFEQKVWGFLLRWINPEMMSSSFTTRGGAEECATQIVTEVIANGSFNCSPDFQGRLCTELRVRGPSRASVAVRGIMLGPRYKITLL